MIRLTTSPDPPVELNTSDVISFMVKINIPFDYGLLNEERDCPNASFMVPPQIQIQTSLSQKDDLKNVVLSFLPGTHTYTSESSIDCSRFISRHIERVTENSLVTEQIARQATIDAGNSQITMDCSFILETVEEEFVLVEQIGTSVTETSFTLSFTIEQESEF